MEKRWVAMPVTVILPLSRDNGSKGNWGLTPTFLLQVKKIKNRVSNDPAFFFVLI
jgi:hypothetical protein